MNEYRTCPGCGRAIADSIFERAGAHAPGCPKRRSILGKEAHRKAVARKERARKAAATRAARKLGLDPSALTPAGLALVRHEAGL